VPPNNPRHHHIPRGVRRLLICLTDRTPFGRPCSDLRTCESCTNVNSVGRGQLPGGGARHCRARAGGAGMTGRGRVAPVGTRDRGQVTARVQEQGQHTRPRTPNPGRSRVPAQCPAVFAALSPSPRIKGRLLLSHTPLPLTLAMSGPIAASIGIRTKGTRGSKAASYINLRLGSSCTAAQCGRRRRGCFRLTGRVIG
jgi:hypothetical protein